MISMIIVVLKSCSAWSWTANCWSQTFDAGDVEYMRRLTAKYDGMDLADASLVSVGERLGFLDVITLDRHDFSRYPDAQPQSLHESLPGTRVARM